MNIFTDAYKKGLEASKSVKNNLEEIDAVFDNLKAEILASSENKISIERGLASYSDLSNYEAITITAIEALKRRVPYKVIIAKNVETSSERPIAEYDIDRKGYPVTIKWTDRNESCQTKDALIATLKDLLADPSTGRKIETLLSKNAETSGS